MRKAILASTAALMLPLAGCYNLVTINAGVANKSAAALAAPLDPTVACAALASAKLTFPTGTQDATDACETILAAQQKRAQPHHP